ncbi:hypothetical protein PUN28_017510 [Cardiocondyla obscurior]|uniref:Fatty acyl-CoA reductase n=1 Tax=Cardiocondyla obscurior TaxID=286306 RepID=A0AAW2EHN3_9HYME
METKNENVYVPAFYANRSIFITGGTGFLGKALIEKLLRSCPDVREIFVLIRPKKGLSVNDRLNKILSNKLFDLLRSRQPSAFDKIVPVTGYVAKENLGLLPSDREMLIDRVSIIFHVAASVRFDEGLKDAIFNNTRSTRDICILASEMKNLVVLLHVSSTYTQTDKLVVDEVLYPSKFDWKKAIEVAERVDEHVLRILTTKYLENMPNTYTFTKRLAEQVISDYSESLPCAIIRPSIVISTTYDPMPGWIDNFNGPVGMLIGGGKGILRVLWSDPNINSDYVPVDVTIKAMILIAWKRGIRKDKITDVCHCSSSLMKCMDVKTIVEIGLDIVKEIPLNNVVWKPRTTITKNYFVYYSLVLILHIIPAMFLDEIMKLFGVQPMLVRLQRKVYVSNRALSYFLLNQWTFRNQNMITMLDNLSAENQKDFGYPYKDVDVVQYFNYLNNIVFNFRDGIIGAKLYLLNESMDELEASKRHYNR